MKKLTQLAVTRRLARLNREYPKNPELTNKHIRDYTFDGLDLSGVQFCDSTLEACVFKGCTLDAAAFNNASLSSVRFINCTFGRTQFVSVMLHNYAFVNCRFSDVEFSGSHFYVGGFWDCAQNTQVAFKSSTFSELYAFEVGLPRLWDVQGDGHLIHSMSIAGHTVAYTKDAVTVDWEIQPIANPDKWLGRGPIMPFKSPPILAWWEVWMPTLRTIIKKAPVTHTKRCEYSEM